MSHPDARLPPQSRRDLVREVAGGWTQAGARPGGSASPAPPRPSGCAATGTRAGPAGRTALERGAGGTLRDEARAARGNGSCRTSSSSRS